MTEILDSNKYKNLLIDVVDSATGEVTEQTMDSLIDQPLSIEVKQNIIAEAFKLFNGDVEALEAQSREIDRQIADKARKREAVRNIMVAIMKKHDVKALSTAFFEAKFKKNPPRVEIDDDANLDRFTKTELIETVDKTAIKQALVAGEVIDGCRLVQGERLEIK